MGCCVSTSSKPTPPLKNTKHDPLMEEEEEIVKEILSETPAVVKPPSHKTPESRPENASPFIKSAPLLRDNKEQQNGVVYKKKFSKDEASEICSRVSESVSASTSLTEKREHNGRRRGELREARQRSPAGLRNRPFSGEMRREKTVGRSPGRRSEPSPGRVRPVSGRSGESCGRRLTSPARKMVIPPGRVGPGPGDRIRKVNGGKESGEVSSELVENPIVSLECFIFL